MKTPIEIIDEMIEEIMETKEVRWLLYDDEWAKLEGYTEVKERIEEEWIYAPVETTYPDWPQWEPHYTITLPNGILTTIKGISIPTGIHTWRVETGK